MNIYKISTSKPSAVTYSYNHLNISPEEIVLNETILNEIFHLLQ